MASTGYPHCVGDAENDCRAFAAEFGTPNVLRGIELAESGRISWLALADLFAKSLHKGLAS